MELAGSKAGDTTINPKDGAEMVWVPAGEFLMGSTEEHVATELKKFERESREVRDLSKMLFEAEKPQRKVYLDGYWIYKYPVTVAQYRRFCEDVGGRTFIGKVFGRKMPQPPAWGRSFFMARWINEHPMVMVNWHDAAAYAEWAGVSLPTDAQWEKAARGADGRIYPWGNEWDASKCANSVTIKLNSTQPVGSYPAGTCPYGAMDMAGNVNEWCADWFDADYYKSGPTRNPTGPSAAVEFTVPGISKVRGARVLRGGSWFNGSDLSFRCADRSHYLTPDDRDNYSGFRCARTL